ncbi:MAG: EamA family transporter [Anaerolineales bacterium]|nr:EamA family transporter [Anaerolineales bacterium]
MLSILFGLTSALTWGAADFCGGIASKRTNVYGVVIGAEGFGMVLFMALALACGEPVPPLQTWLWGSASGLSGGIGLLLLYHALSSGRMSVAAPVSAVSAAIIPVVVGAVVDGLPGVWTFAGILLALAAVWLIARGEGGRENAAIRLNEITLPLIAGVVFGMYFVFMHQASREAFFWPIVASRLASTVGILGYALVTRQPWGPERKHWPLIALSGLLDVSGNAFYVLGGQIGRLDVAAVLGSLYPGSTVLLAGLFLHERFSRLQLAGILAALAAIVLMTV